MRVVFYCYIASTILYALLPDSLAQKAAFLDVYPQLERIFLEYLCR